MILGFVIGLITAFMLVVFCSWLRFEMMSNLGCENETTERFESSTLVEVMDRKSEKDHKDN